MRRDSKSPLLGWHGLEPKCLEPKWLLNQARSDLAKQELHVEFLNKCIGELQRQTEEQRSAIQDAQYGFVEPRREQVRRQEEKSMEEKVLRNTQIRNMREMGRMKRAKELQVEEVSMQKEKITGQFSISLPSCNKCKNRWILLMILEIAQDVEWQVLSRFQSTCDDSEFSFLAQPRQKIAAWHVESIWVTRKHFWKWIFYVWSSEERQNQKHRFKNLATTCSDFPSVAMLWIKEVEMVDSLDELKSSRSVCGKN